MRRAKRWLIPVGPKDAKCGRFVWDFSSQGWRRGGVMGAEFPARSMPDTSAPNPIPGAAFLSYAREDTDAARRIADALRGFGVEVWFDQAELRGGDAWDAQIRKQIRECALFIPVISARTEARGEGYFRLEWNLADERTRLMAKGVVFLLPVV